MEQVFRKKIRDQECRLDRLQKQLSDLHAMSTQLANSLQRDQILSNVRHVMTGMIPCYGGFLFIKEIQSGEFKLTGSIGGKGEMINSAMVDRSSFQETFEPIQKSITMERATLDLLNVEKMDFLKKNIILELSRLTKNRLMRCCLPLLVSKELLGLAVFYGDSKEFEALEWESLSLRSMMHLASIALGSAVQNELAVHDRLTRLYNHGFFHEELSRAMDEAHGYLASGPRQGCVSLILMDIDHFKSFNDTHGHQTGDAVLRQIADILRMNCNPYYETAARYGGEEFAVIMRMAPLMSETPIDGNFEDLDLIRMGGSVAKAEALRRKISQTVFEGAQVPLHVTVSLGVGCWRYPQDEDMC